MRIRRGLGSRRLPCRCQAGIYETYKEEIIAIIDVVHPECGDPSHRPGQVVPVDHTAAAAAEVLGR